MDNIQITAPRTNTLPRHSQPALSGNRLTSKLDTYCASPSTPLVIAILILIIMSAVLLNRTYQGEKIDAVLSAIHDNTGLVFRTDNGLSVVLGKGGYFHICRTRNHETIFDIRIFENGTATPVGAQLNILQIRELALIVRHQLHNGGLHSPYRACVFQSVLLILRSVKKGVSCEIRLLNHDGSPSIKGIVLISGQTERFFVALEHLQMLLDILRNGQVRCAFCDPKVCFGHPQNTTYT